MRSKVAALLVTVGLAYAATNPKQIILRILALYRRINLLYLGLKNSTPDAEIENRVVSGKSWDEFCDALKSAGAALVAPGAPTDAFSQAEGYRYLTRLARGGLTAFLECKNWDKPVFHALANGDAVDPVKIGSDNPDNLYQSASISGRKAYLVTVKRNTVHYLGFGTQAGQYGSAGGLSTVESKESALFSFDVDEDAKVFSLLVSPFTNFEELKDFKNVIKTKADPEDALLIVRQTFERRDIEVEADLKIVKLGDFIDTPSGWKFAPYVKEELEGRFDMNDKLTCEHLSKSLDNTTLLVNGASLMFASWARGFKSHANQLPLFDVEKSNKVGGDPSIRYYHSYWRLADNECLVIKVKPPADLFTWNFQVNNYWMESLDYRNYPIHVNKGTAKYTQDGSICIVVSLHDPKPSTSTPYNWLCTTGHNEGTMCFRWIKPASFDNLPQPQTTVLNCSDLANHI